MFKKFFQFKNISHRECLVTITSNKATLFWWRGVGCSSQSQQICVVGGAVKLTANNVIMFVAFSDRQIFNNLSKKRKSKGCCCLFVFSLEGKMQPFNLKCITLCCWFRLSTIKRKLRFPNFYKSELQRGKFLMKDERT